MGISVSSVGPKEAVEDALNRIRQMGLDIEPAARKELEELALAGFRLMQESRVLDLPSDDPDRVDAELLAQSNLMRLVDSWIHIERERGRSVLTTSGFKRAYALNCPVYPCEKR